MNSPRSNEQRWEDPWSDDDLRETYLPPTGPHLIVRSETSARRFIASGPHRHLVYVLHDRSGAPIYVGVAGNADRAFSHLADALAHRDGKGRDVRVKHDVLRQLGAVLYSIDSFHETEAQARVRERNLVHIFGRRKDGTGPLLNGQHEHSHLGPGGAISGFELPHFVLECEPVQRPSSGVPGS